MSVNKAAFINQIITAVPKNEGHSHFLEYLCKICPSHTELEKLAQIDARTQIGKRYTVLNDFFSFNGSNPKAFYQEDQFPTTADRMQRYQREALPLARKALGEILSNGLHDKITHLIITSCTGFYTPGLDIDIIHAFDLNPSVERSLIGYMGCYAAIPALKIAQNIVLSHPLAKVLMVNLELCSLHWQKQASFDQMLSYLLFSDGCSVSLISVEPIGLRIETFHGCVLPKTKNMMSWTIGNDGFYMNLDPGIPKNLIRGIVQEKDRILDGKRSQQFKFWAIHPGGRIILDLVQRVLKLSDSDMDASRDVLKNFGNMSSPTLMFILKKFLDESDSQGIGCAMGFGPGLVLESFCFHKGAS